MLRHLLLVFALLVLLSGCSATPYLTGSNDMAPSLPGGGKVQFFYENPRDPYLPDNQTGTYIFGKRSDQPYMTGGPGLKLEWHF